MASLRAADLRWLAVIPAAVAGAAVAQVAVTGPAYSVLLVAGGSSLTEPWWIAKVVASAFMGAAFVGCAWLTAPTREAAVGLVALGAVAVWSGWLVVSSVGLPGFAWPALLGVAGFAGGLALFAVLSRPHFM